MKTEKPSSLALAVFYWFCHSDYREEIEGDLLERFHQKVKSEGVFKANLSFINDVVFLFRPSLTKSIYQLTSTEHMIFTTHYRRKAIVLAIACGLLCIPLIAMLFTNEVNWSIFDFIVASILLMGTGLLLEVILRKVKSTRTRLLLAGFILVLFLLTWLELAVGIFGSPFAGS